MIIYHGSKEIIKYPKVKGSNFKNDYGPAFYMTTELSSAKSWACKNGEVGVVNKYVIDERRFNSLKILDLTEGKLFTVLNWLAILVHFRQFDSTYKTSFIEKIKWLEKYYIDVNEFDVVKGFRADDAYFRFAKDFINGTLAFEDLETVFKLGNLGIQYALISERAIKLLKFEKIIDCDSSYVGHHYNIVKEATEIYRKILNSEGTINKTYILDLMRKDNE